MTDTPDRLGTDRSVSDSLDRVGGACRTNVRTNELTEKGLTMRADLSGVDARDARPRYAPGGEPRAVVERVSRRTWRIAIHYTLTVPGVVRAIETTHGPEGYGWHCWGSRERADRKAARILRRFLRRDAYPCEQHVVRVDLR